MSHCTLRHKKNVIKNEHERFVKKNTQKKKYTIELCSEDYQAIKTKHNKRFGENGKISLSTFECDIVTFFSLSQFIKRNQMIF